MAAVSRVYRFDKDLARQILKLANDDASPNIFTTEKIAEMDPFAEYPYEAIVTNVLRLWDDACLHLQVSDIQEGPLQGQTNYHILTITSIGEDRLKTLQRDCV